MPTAGGADAAQLAEMLGSVAKDTDKAKSSMGKAFKTAFSSVEKFGTVIDKHLYSGLDSATTTAHTFNASDLDNVVMHRLGHTHSACKKEGRRQAGATAPRLR